MAEEGHPSRYVKLTKDQDAPGEDILPGELNQPVHVPQLEGRRCSECGQALPETYEPPADEPWTTGIFGCTDDPESCTYHRDPPPPSFPLCPSFTATRPRVNHAALIPCGAAPPAVALGLPVPDSSPCMFNRVPSRQRFDQSIGHTGLFCPCVLFGRNVEALREDIPWTTPCVCHAVFVEGGIALAILTAIFHGIDPRSSFLIGEGLVFSWWLCGTYTGIFRQELQKRYHLKNSPCDPCMTHCCLHWCANCQEHRERRGRLVDHSAVPMTVVNPPPVQEMSISENRDAPATATSPETNGASNNAKLEAHKSDHDDIEVIPL